QRQVVNEITSSLVGKTFEVVCDGVDYDKQYFYGRAYFNAPDIDGKVYLKSDGVINEGKTYKVKITSVADYDLYGEIENEA
ncbi:MAG TPA: 30S ribosomal protein S12 methylthiotransferase RimO, partial [Clostridiales bacterium]|nr:30S ribosomal protein S12 methylthiotransferase RimO [Clostridiales bacterium]